MIMYFEHLEPRYALGGLVQIAVDGNLVLAGDDATNDVEIQGGDAAGQLVIVPRAGTLLSYRGQFTLDPLAVDGVVGDVRVDLGGEDPLGDDALAVAGAVLPGDLVVERTPRLRVVDSVIAGEFLVDNRAAEHSNLLFRGSAAGRFEVRNGPGPDITQVEGATAFGRGDASEVVFRVRNGAGGSRTTITGESDIRGAVEVLNAENEGALDIVTFNGMIAAGEVYVGHGAGDSITSAQDTAVQGGPFQVDCGPGADQILLYGLDAPWGIEINTDFGAEALWGWLAVETAERTERDRTGMATEIPIYFWL